MIDSTIFWRTVLVLVALAVLPSAAMGWVVIGILIYWLQWIFKDYSDMKDGK